MASGLASVTNIVIVNGVVDVPGFAQGTVSVVTVVAVKTDPTKATEWSFDATDMAGHTTHCGRLWFPGVDGKLVGGTPAVAGVTVGKEELTQQGSSHQGIQAAGTQPGRCLSRQNPSIPKASAIGWGLCLPGPTRTTAIGIGTGARPLKWLPRTPARQPNMSGLGDDV